MYKQVQGTGLPTPTTLTQRTTMYCNHRACKSTLASVTSWKGEGKLAHVFYTHTQILQARGRVTAMGSNTS